MKLIGYNKRARHFIKINVHFCHLSKYGADSLTMVAISRPWWYHDQWPWPSWSNQDHRKAIIWLDLDLSKSKIQPWWTMISPWWRRGTMASVENVFEKFLESFLCPFHISWSHRVRITFEGNGRTWLGRIWALQVLNNSWTINLQCQSQTIWNSE